MCRPSIACRTGPYVIFLPPRDILTRRLDTHLIFLVRKARNCVTPGVMDNPLDTSPMLTSVNLGSILGIGVPKRRL